MYYLKDTYFKYEDTNRIQAKEWDKYRDKIILKFTHKSRGMKIAKTILRKI